MTLTDAQRANRRTYRGGLAGQLVSAAIWAASAAIAQWGDHWTGMLALVVGGFFIYPLTALSLKLAGHDVRANAANPLNALAMQVAFTVPLALPVVLTLTHFAPRFFYPSVMMVLGAHYLPFVTLYGTRAWLGLAAALLAGGWVLGWMMPMGITAGGWFTSAALAAYAIVGWRLVVAEEKRAAA